MRRIDISSNSLEDNNGIGIRIVAEGPEGSWRNQQTVERETGSSKASVPVNRSWAYE